MFTSSNPLRVWSLVVLGGCLAAPAVAATRVVDQDGQASAADCSAATAAFLTIGSAITASSTNDTIIVCPGTGPYNEQLVINKPLTIKGFAPRAVVIQPSPMAANTTSLFNGAPIAAAVLVADTDATLSHLVVDGSAAGLSDCGTNAVGIFFRNASGSVDDSTVREIKLTAGNERCQSGVGIFAQSGGGGSSDVTVERVSVHHYQKNGIVANELGTILTVRDSFVAGDPPANATVQNGIQIAFGAAGSIEHNTVVDQIYLPCTPAACSPGASIGILVFDAATDVLVAENRISKTQVGIFLGGGVIQPGTNGSGISDNVITDTRVFDGIFIFGDGHTITRNSITSTDGSGVFLWGSDNWVNFNRIQEAAIGIWNYSGTGNTLPTGTRGNTLVNVEQRVVNGLTPAGPTPAEGERSMPLRAVFR